MTEWLNDTGTERKRIFVMTVVGLVLQVANNVIHEAVATNH